MVAVLLMVGATALTAQTPKSGVEIISVCQLLSDPAAVDGKQVNIRGVYRLVISDPTCSGRIKHKDQEWSGSVWLEILKSTKGSDALDRARASLSGTSNVVWATFSGRVEYCPKQVKMGGKVQWLGCGHVGDYILQIFADAVTDVEVKPSDNPGSKEALEQSPTQVSVCDLLRDPSEWNDRIVQVSADVDFDGLPERSPSLSGRKCSTNIMVSGLSFPNLIVLTDPQLGVLRVHNVDFEFDETAKSQFRRLLEIVRPKSEHIRVTVIGLFETRSPVGDLVRFNNVHPQGQRLGFGVGGVYPAQILLRTMTGMRIENNQSPQQ